MLTRQQPRRSIPHRPGDHRNALPALTFDKHVWQMVHTVGYEIQPEIHGVFMAEESLWLRALRRQAP